MKAKTTKHTPEKDSPSFRWNPFRFSLLEKDMRKSKSPKCASGAKSSAAWMLRCLNAECLSDEAHLPPSTWPGMSWTRRRRGLSRTAPAPTQVTFIGYDDDECASSSWTPWTIATLRGFILKESFSIFYSYIVWVFCEKSSKFNYRLLIDFIFTCWWFEIKYCTNRDIFDNLENIMLYMSLFFVLFILIQSKSRPIDRITNQKTHQKLFIMTHSSIITIQL